MLRGIVEHRHKVIVSSQSLSLLLNFLVDEWADVFLDARSMNLEQVVAPVDLLWAPVEQLLVIDLES